MGMASIINGEPPTFRYSDVTAVLVNDQNTIFMVKIMVWQKVRHIHSIIPSHRIFMITAMPSFAMTTPLSVRHHNRAAIAL